MATLAIQNDTDLSPLTHFEVAPQAPLKSALCQLLEKGNLITTNPVTREFEVVSVQGLDPLQSRYEYLYIIDNLVDNAIYEAKLNGQSTVYDPNQDVAVEFFTKAKLHWCHDSERMRSVYRLSLAMLLMFDERRTNNKEGEKYQMFKWAVILNRFNDRIGFQNLQEFMGIGNDLDFDYVCKWLNYNPIAKFASQTLPPRQG